MRERARAPYTFNTNKLPAEGVFSQTCHALARSRTKKSTVSDDDSPESTLCVLFSCCFS